MQLLAFLAWLCLLDRAHSPTQAAALAGAFSVTALSVTFGWLYTSMHVYGGLNAGLAVVAVVALAGALSLYYAGAAWIYRVLAGNPGVSHALLFAALWTMAEMARGQWLTGFGWGALAYAHLDGPFAAWVPWVGVYGVCALVALQCMLWIQFLTAGSVPGRWLYLAAGGLIWALPQFLPHLHSEPGPSLRVALLQGNIAQEEKFEAGTGVARALAWYAQQLAANDSQLIVTPETALPLLPEQLPPGYWLSLQHAYAQGQQAALIGIPMGSMAAGYTNSVIGLRPGQTEPWRYDKHHLVPFGEFVPPLFRWFTDMMQIPLGDFTRGPLPQPNFDWMGQRLATSVCYENLFSEEIAAAFTRSDHAPTLLVNLSNLGWFGEHLAMDQHLNIARMRSKEFQRPFLLATNTGRTAVVNHLGQVTHAAPAHQAAVLKAEVQGRTGRTPYAAWVSAFGQWPIWLLGLACALWAGWVKRSALGRA